MSVYPSGTLIANRPAKGGMQGPREKPSLAGGMGLVYLCVDHAETCPDPPLWGGNGRPVALKTFRPELLPDRAARDRFLREGTTWVQLGKHPYIFRCHE
jgi:serine/threonine protein kinase